MFTEGCGIDYKGKGIGPGGPDIPGVEVFNTEDIEEVVEDTVINKIGAAIMGFNRGLSKALNPYNYLPNTSYRGMSHSDFIKMQSDHHTSVNTLYPYP